MSRRIFISVFAFLSCLPSAVGISPTAFSSVRVGGELRTRIERNFQRLHEDRYQPQRVFLTDEESGYWPGDYEGRTLLALVMDAQTLAQEPLYLQQFLQLLPAHLNERGYMGSISDEVISEQQLSGNGWLLRGLCEYYAWKGDKTVLPIIRNIAQNLFVRARGQYSKYPINPDQRRQNVGDASGSQQNIVDGWLLSSDVGCVFIGMEGLIHAYQYVKTKEMRGVIEEMIARFLSIDLVAIKAQTHASLTACRGLVRWGDLTGCSKFYDDAEYRYKLYKQYGMTANYENFNWFGRRDTWTEPCAIVDSYMLALQLWERTGKAEYRTDAELIYYNALCHTQRYNGGFGCDSCLSDEQPALSIHAPEAYWCCTMRGAEGLATAARYSYMLQTDTLVLPFLHESKLLLHAKNGVLAISQHTDYPFGDSVILTIGENSTDICAVSLPVLPWAGSFAFYVNGHSIQPAQHNGFFILPHKPCAGDTIKVSFRLKNCQHGHRCFYGPLLLGADADNPSVLSPVYHLLDPKVWGKGYLKQIVF